MARRKQVIKKTRGVIVQIYDKYDYLIEGPTHIEEVDGEKTLAALEMFLQVCGIKEKEANYIREAVSKDKEKQDVLITIAINQSGRDFLIDDWGDTEGMKTKKKNE